MMTEDRNVNNETQLDDQLKILDHARHPQPDAQLLDKIGTAVRKQLAVQRRRRMWVRTAAVSAAAAGIVLAAAIWAHYTVPGPNHIGHGPAVSRTDPIEQMVDLLLEEAESKDRLISGFDEVHEEQPTTNALAEPLDYMVWELAL